MLLQTKLLLAIGIILFSIFAALGFVSYQGTQENARNELLDQAEKVRNVLMSMPRVYHKQFMDSGVALTEKTVGFLPAHAMNRISQDYPNWDTSGFSFNNVSDTPRNKSQQADSHELEVMAYFRQNPKAELTFKPFTTENGEEFYLYARPIWIEKYCLKCHGEKENAPETIRQLYDTAWGYQEGQLRGLLSIKLPSRTVKERALKHFYQSALVQLAGFMSIFLLVMVIIRYNVTRPLTEIANGMKAVAEGDYGQQVMRGKGEFAILSDSFNNMTEQVKEKREALQKLNEELEQRIAKRTAQLAQANQEITMLNERLQEENLRLSAELEVSRKIQKMVLPTADELKQINNLDIAAFMEPATEVGGDYYDILQHNGTVKISIGDVTGHGLESGVLMLMAQMGVRTLLANNVTDLRVFLNVLNRAIFDNLQRMKMDKNLSFALLDYEEGKVRLAGQHEEVLVVRQNGEVERVDTLQLGYALGLKADIEHFLEQTEIYLAVGDGLVLYSDGITEAMDSREEMYSVDRLIAAVSKQWKESSAEQVQQAVISDLQAHLGSQQIADDITLLVIKRRM